MDTLTYRLRFPLLALGFLALFAAMWAGLLRMGWNWPHIQPGLIMAHGPLMVSGFLGTVIGLERAVALNKLWAYAGPLAAGLGGLMLIFGAPGIVGPLLMTLGSVGLVVVFAKIVKTHAAIFTVTMAAGALFWLVGNVLWLFGLPVSQVVLWWSGFLLLTIAGERLELNRVLRLSGPVITLFTALISLYFLGAVIALFNLGAGMRLSGAVMAGLALWLLRFDVTRYTIKKFGLTRFIAASLLVGYVWLGVSGLMGLLWGGLTAGPYYDAVLHTFYIGFVISMIFGHAPIIFPAVLKRALAYSPAFYAHLILLHIGLLLRVAGDLSGSLAARQWGGLLNALAIILFVVNTVVAVKRGNSST